MIEHPLLLSTHDVCERLHLSHSTVIRLVRLGQLRPFRVGVRHPHFAFAPEGILAITEVSAETRSWTLLGRQERRGKKQQHWHDQAQLIISLVCRHMHVPTNRLRIGRYGHAKMTRDICVWLMREIPIPPISYPVIGSILCRDHSTCIVAYQRIMLRPKVLAAMTFLRERVEDALREREAKTMVSMAPEMPQDEVLAVKAGVDAR